jgi:ricin-type beta-trefoil lectin protein
MKIRRVLAALGAGLLMSGAFVALAAPAANAIVTAEFHPLVDRGSGKCVTVLPNANGYVDNGLRLVQATCDGSLVQKWQFLQVGDRCDPNCSFSVPIYWIQNQGTGKCMDLNNGSSVNGTPVQQWSCVNNDNMKWVLDPNPHNLKPDDYFTISNQRGGTCLDVTNGSIDEFAPLQGYHCFDFPNNGAQMYRQT